MEWKEALPLLQENHTGVAISVTPKGRAQSTIVSTAVLDGKLGFASRDYTVKVKNIQRTGRATVTVVKLDTRRYVTVEGPASIEPWQDTPAHIKRLKDLYVAMGRAPKGTDEEFAQQMRDEERNLVLVTPESLYGWNTLANLNVLNVWNDWNQLTRRWFERLKRFERSMSLSH